MQTQLVIFDFDGTLVDTAPDLVRATNLFLESEGYDPLSEFRIRKEIGNGLRKLIFEVYPDHELTDIARRQIEGRFLAVYEREYLTSPRLFDGALEFLTEWEGQIAIVSNKRIRFILPILEKLQIHNLPWVKVIGGDTYPHMKPHPEPILAAIQAAGTTPEETVIVGDGTPDVAGALAVGCRCIAVEHGYQTAEELMNLGATSSIESFHDLLPLLRTPTV
jgi:2-phosphoglycolate phosphatase